MGLIVAELLWFFFLIIAVEALVLLGLLIYAHWNYGKLEKLGIPVMKPHWFLGSNPNAHNEIVHLVDLERSKTYGPVYGVYDGRAPTVFVSDPQIFRLIQSQDFDYFRNHRSLLVREHPLMAELLDFLDGPRMCIGQRFAYEMLSIILVHYLEKFRFERRADTVFNVRAGNPLFVTYDPIQTNFVKKNMNFY